jgi:uncharacterized protein YjbI with pentapeptide repeats
MSYELWRETTLTVGTALALLGFFRGQEQRQDADFHELGVRLSDSDSAMMRATAATQLPAYFGYRRYLILRRPYRHQALGFALNGLKVSDEEKFVRQALVDALGAMLRRRRRHEFPVLNLIDAHLDELIMFGFPFDGTDLTQASLAHSDLGSASFVNAKLWRANLSHAKLTDANLTGAQLWDANLSHANLENALIRTPHVNAQTRFDHANLKGATLSRAIVDVCNLRDLEGVTIED